MEVNIDFEGKDQPKDTPNPNPNPNPNNPPANPQDDTTALNHEHEKTNLNNPNPNSKDNPKDNPKDNSNPDENEIELTEGMNIEFGDITYTVDKDGNLVDDKGEIFKNKDEVQAWIKEQGIETEEPENDGTLNFKSIKEAVGVSITDDEDKEVEYEDTPAGIAQYINDVIDQKVQENNDGVVNNFLDQNPLVKEFIDYVNVYGTYQGFGEVKDRTTVVLDKENENQLENIIRTAAKEFGNATINDNYIKYLKSSGTLYDEAKAQLEALIAKDKKDQEQRELLNRQRLQEEVKKQEELISSIKEKVKTRTIGDFVLPEHIQKDINGKKYTLSINDFIDYIFKPTIKLEDGSRISQYDYDDYNANGTDEEFTYNVMKAWLRFTGGSLKDLAKYISNEEKAKNLKIKSNEIRSQRTIKVKSKPQKVDMNDILLS